MRRHLNLIFRSAKDSLTSCYLAIINVSKAFDSISHTVIDDTLASYGFPEDFRNYIANYYGSSKTSVLGHGWKSDKILPSRRLDRGTPCRPCHSTSWWIVFSDCPKRLGVMSVGVGGVNSLAYADDLVLCASMAVSVRCSICPPNISRSAFCQ